MTYRGVYRDGVIVPGDALDIPNGSKVEFAIVPPRRSAAKATKSASARRPRSRKKSKRMTAEERIAAFMQGFGISRDRPDWKGKSTQEIARELRRRAAGNWERPRKLARG